MPLVAVGTLMWRTSNSPVLKCAKEIKIALHRHLHWYIFRFICTWRSICFWSLSFPPAPGRTRMWQSLMDRTRVARTAGRLLMLILHPVPRTARRRKFRGTWSDHWSPGPSMPLWSKLNCLHLTSTRFMEPRARSSTSAPMPPVSYTTEKHTHPKGKYFSTLF